MPQCPGSVRYSSECNSRLGTASDAVAAKSGVDGRQSALGAVIDRGCGCCRSWSRARYAAARTVWCCAMQIKCRHVPASANLRGKVLSSTQPSPAALLSLAPAPPLQNAVVCCAAHSMSAEAEASNHLYGRELWKALIACVAHSSSVSAAARIRSTPNRSCERTRGAHRLTRLAPPAAGWPLSSVLCAQRLGWELPRVVRLCAVRHVCE